MIKRTSINLDRDLLAEAATILGTSRPTDTVHAAMREVVGRTRRRRLAARDFPGLIQEPLSEMRSPRTFRPPIRGA